MVAAAITALPTAAACCCWKALPDAQTLPLPARGRSATVRMRSNAPTPKHSLRSDATNASCAGLQTTSACRGAGTKDLERAIEASRPSSQGKSHSPRTALTPWKTAQDGSHDDGHLHRLQLAAGPFCSATYDALASEMKTRSTGASTDLECAIVSLAFAGLRVSPARLLHI